MVKGQDIPLCPRCGSRVVLSLEPSGQGGLVRCTQADCATQASSCLRLRDAKRSWRRLVARLGARPAAAEAAGESS